MNRKAKGSLIHGIINVILPIAVVLIHQGVLGTSNADNAWNYFIVGILFALVPVISSIIGIVVANVRLKKSSEKAIKAGLALSIIGLVTQIVFRFVLKL